MHKRIMDLITAIFGAIISVVPCLLIVVAIKLTSAGPALHWSRRAGRNGQVFTMPKFRTMHVNTPELATDKLANPNQYLTAIGPFLRRTSLDELPQLYSVLCGDMSIVGPRPALHNQFKLIKERSRLGIDVLRPGITGWAQINGRDTITLAEKLRLDGEYLRKQTLFFDTKIIIMTIASVVRSRGITH